MKEEDRVPLKRWRAGNSRVKPALASGTQAHSARALTRAEGVSDTGLQWVNSTTRITTDDGHHTNWDPTAKQTC